MGAAQRATHGFKAMDFWLTMLAVAILVAAVVFVLGNHWQEFHGDNHF